MAMSRGQQLLRQQKRNGIVIDAVVDDSVQKEAIILELKEKGIEATKRESIANLKKKLAGAE